MTPWMYGVGFIALVLVIGILKADTQTRIVLTVAAIAAVLFFRAQSKRR
jgi:hypothetical protein